MEDKDKLEVAYYAANEALKLKRIEIFETALAFHTESVEAYKKAFKELDVLQEARNEALDKACVGYRKHLTSPKRTKKSHYLTPNPGDRYRLRFVTNESAQLLLTDAQETARAELVEQQLEVARLKMQNF